MASTVSEKSDCSALPTEPSSNNVARTSYNNANSSQPLLSCQLSTSSAVPHLKPCHVCGRSFKNIKSHFTKSHPDISYPYASTSADTNRNAALAQEPEAFGHLLAQLHSGNPTLRRVPRGARPAVAAALCHLLESLAASNDLQAWRDLFLFAHVVLSTPPRSARVKNLTSLIKQRTQLWTEGHRSPPASRSRSSRPHGSPDSYISKKAEAKLADGDVSGAIRIISSTDTFASPDQSTIAALRSKHPAHPLPTSFPDHPSLLPNVGDVTPVEIGDCIRTFAPGSSGGLDGIHPQVLKDLLSCADSTITTPLRAAIASVCSLVMRGLVCQEFRPLFYGGSLTALLKKDGGIRPIAVGNVWRRLASKIWCRRLGPSMHPLFLPCQLGVGIPLGAEAGAHSARIYLSTPHDTLKAFVKLDFRNAFNELRRDRMLEAVLSGFPELFPYTFQSYANTSWLFYGDTLIESRCGVQQGDPLGPLLFALTIHPLVSSIQSEFNMWFLDDGSVAGTIPDVLAALKKIKMDSASLGLHLNTTKSEVLLVGPLSEADIPTVLKSFDAIAPGLRTIDSSTGTLLGSALTDDSITHVIDLKTNKLRFFLHRLQKLSAHAAMFLLRCSFSALRLIYFLRSVPCWRNFPALEVYDDVVRSGLETILNCSFSPTSWSQASLPIRAGGLGIRRSVDLAFPTFLASFHGSLNIIGGLITSERLSRYPAVQECEAAFSQILGSTLPPLLAKSKQRAWDDLLVEKTRKSHLQSAPSGSDRARLLAVSSQEASAWLLARPSAQLGLHLPDEVLRISVAVRLGADVCQPHSCICGNRVDSKGLHGLSCLRSAGRLTRHTEVNDLIFRALTAAGVPSLREPPGCSRTDNKRPDGMTLIPWESGKAILWDFSCCDTFAASYIDSTSTSAGAAALQREADKRRKYVPLFDRYLFAPVVIETAGSWGPEGLSFIKNIGHRLAVASQNPRSSAYLIQRISLAIQRGNAVSILGTLPKGRGLDEIFNF